MVVDWLQWEGDVDKLVGTQFVDLTGGMPILQVDMAKGDHFGWRRLLSQFKFPQVITTEVPPGP